MLTNFKKNIMGTISFDMQLKGWRKPQEFIVYPMSESADAILVQSDKRWAEINPETGETQMTNGKGGHQNRWLLMFQQARKQAVSFTMDPLDLQALKMHIFTTAGKQVGNLVLSDNSAANQIL